MVRLRRMQKQRRSAGAGERGGNFATDQARLAYASDDHAALALEQEFDCFVETRIQPAEQAFDGLGLDAQHASGGFETHTVLQPRTSTAHRTSLSRKRGSRLTGTASEHSD